MGKENQSEDLKINGLRIHEETMPSLRDRQTEVSRNEFLIESNVTALLSKRGCYHPMKYCFPSLPWHY